MFVLKTIQDTLRGKIADKYWKVSLKSMMFAVQAKNIKETAYPNC